MKILGIVGSYRKNGIIDSLVSETLSSAEALGAITKKMYLSDAHIEFIRRITKKGSAYKHYRNKITQKDLGHNKNRGGLPESQAP